MLSKQTLYFGLFLSTLVLISPSFTNTSETELKPEFTCEMEGFQEAAEGRSNILDKSRLWEDGRVIFEFDPSFGPEAQKVFNQAMEQFHERTCIRWVPRQQETGYVHVWIDHNASAPCGRAHVCSLGIKQIFALTPSCVDLHTTVHEMLHALCFIHEHQRTDRDEFLSFDGCSSIPKIHRGQWNNGGLYDYWSAISYPCRKGSCSGYPKFKVTRCGGERNRNGLLALDADKVNDFYNCQTRCHTHRWYNIQNMTDGDPRWSHLLNIAPAGEDPVHICRTFNGDDWEVTSGVFNRAEGTCQLNYNHRVVNIDKYIELLALPWDARSVTTTSSPYYFAPFQQKNEEQWKYFVPTGRSLYSGVVNSYLAVTRVIGGAGTYNKTRVGNVGHMSNGAKFPEPNPSHPHLASVFLRDFYVLACNKMEFK